MPPEDGRPVILMSQSSNPKIGYRGLHPTDPYSENAHRDGAGASSRGRVQSRNQSFSKASEFSRRQKLTGSAMIIRSNKESSS